MSTSTRNMKIARITLKKNSFTTLAALEEYLGALNLLPRPLSGYSLALVGASANLASKPLTVLRGRLAFLC